MHQHVIPTIRHLTTPRSLATYAAAAALLLTGCGDDDGDDAAVEVTEPSSTEPATATAPTPDTTLATSSGDATSSASGSRTLDVDSTWFWQLQDDVQGPFVYDMYDLDLFETPPEVIDAVHDAGAVLICYFSAGSYEEWRPDAGDYPADVIGETLDGWEDERWVDIRSDQVRDVLAARLDRAATIGCDGVEPDNMTAYRNDTGFDLSPDDQIDFNRFLAEAAHERGLLIGLKNNLEQIPDLVDDFDFAVNEECHQYDECDVYEPFVAAGKPVFNAEYADEFVNDPSAICATSAALGLTTIVLPLDLDGSFRIGCDEA